MVNKWKVYSERIKILVLRLHKHVIEWFISLFTRFYHFWHVLGRSQGYELLNGPEYMSNWKLSKSAQNILPKIWFFGIGYLVCLETTSDSFLVILKTLQPQFLKAYFSTLLTQCPTQSWPQPWSMSQRLLLKWKSSQSTYLILSLWVLTRTAYTDSSLASMRVLPGKHLIVSPTCFLKKIPTVEMKMDASDILHEGNLGLANLYLILRMLHGSMTVCSMHTPWLSFVWTGSMTN